MEKIYDPHAIEKKWYTLWIEKGYFAAGNNLNGNPTPERNGFTPYGARPQ
jgi:valyl-tRNA synthetase